MRSAVMILALLIVLGGVFFLVVLRGRPALHAGVPTTRAATRAAAPMVVPSTIATLNPEASIVGRSEGVWINTIDPRTQKLVKAFRFERLDPRKDDAVDVTRPQARFYADDGGVLELEGTDGVVVYTQSGDHADAKAMGSATPDNGVFRNVTIRQFAGPANERATLVATLPAIRFDSNDNRIATIDSVIDGRGVLADQVPVTVRGDDYEFDGRGLTMRWNDRDGRIEELKVHHGERLLIRDVNQFGGGSAPIANDGKPTPALAPADLLTGLVVTDQPTTEHATISTSHRSAAQPAAVVAATRPTRGALCYYARFQQDVRVVSSGVQRATADTMNIVFPTTDRREARAASASVMPKPSGTAGADASRGDAGATPTTRPTRRAAASKPFVDRTTAVAATTRPAEPLEIFWTGPLTVRPAEAAETPAAGGKMIEFVGSPAHVAQGAATLDARVIHVEPDAGLARVEPGGTVRAISLRVGAGLQLRSRSALLIDRASGIARIEGGGTLTMAADGPASGAANAPAPARAPTTVAWTRRMELRLAPFDARPDGPQWLQSIDLEGDASVRSDTFAMSGQRLNFGFEEPDVPPATTAADTMLASPDARFLRVASAVGNARIEAGAGDDHRVLAGGDIELGLTEQDGAAALTSIVCRDDVAMIDARGTELHCDHLDVGVKPLSLVAATTAPATTRPADQDSIALLDRLDAHGNVRLNQPDGSTATGDSLTLIERDGGKRIALAGVPAIAATPRATLTSTSLLLDPSTGDVLVPNAGTLVSADPTKPGANGSVSWTQSLAFVNDAARVEIRGDVTIDNREADGGTLHATSDQASLVLASSSSTRPPESRAANRPTSMPSFDAIRSAVLEGNVDVSVASADSRHANVQTSLLTIDVARHRNATPARVSAARRRGPQLGERDGARRAREEDITDSLLN